MSSDKHDVTIFPLRVGDTTTKHLNTSHTGQHKYSFRLLPLRYFLLPLPAPILLNLNFSSHFNYCRDLFF